MTRRTIPRPCLLLVLFVTSWIAGAWGLSHPAHGAPPDEPAAGKKHPGGHHGAHHRFKDADRWAKRFEDPARDAWQKPEAVIAALDLAQGARVADIGSATGYFTVRLARKVPRGTVYGVDIEPDMVRYLSARARKEGLDNLRGVIGGPDDPKLPEPVDLVFLCNTYHHISDRVAYFGKVRRMLRAGGRVAVVDFKLIDTPVGPRKAHRVGPKTLTRELAAAGFRRLSLDTKTLPYQYIALFELNPDTPRRAPPEQ